MSTRAAPSGAAAVGAVGAVIATAIATVVAVAAVSPAKAQQDLSFERADAVERIERTEGGGRTGGSEHTAGAWRVEAGPAAVVATDTAVARHGERSLKIDAGPEAARARVTQTFAADAVGGERLRISGHFRTDGAGAGAEAGGSSPSLWIRIDGPEGLLYIDRASGADAGADGGAERGAARGWTRHALDAPVSGRATRIRFGADWRGSGTLWLDDFAVTTVDLDAVPPAAPAAARYLDWALDIMQRNSLNRARIDWSAFKAAATRQARGATRIEDIYPALQYALGELADGHSYLMTPGRMGALDDGPVSNARTGRDPRAPRGELLPTAEGRGVDRSADGTAAGPATDGNADRTAGYIWIPGFAGGSHGDQVEFAEEVQEIVARLDEPSTCGWIVDLRDNSGGNLWPMLVGIGPLLDGGPTGAAVYPDGQRIDHWYEDGRAGLGEYVQLRIRGEAHSLRERDGGVAVLTDESTASAAEVLTVAFRGQPNARSFGTPTRGVSTGTRIFPLSDGAALVLAVAATSGRDGTVYTGPIAPDERVEPDERAVDAALDWLSQRDACASSSAASSAASRR